MSKSNEDTPRDTLMKGIFGVLQGIRSYIQSLTNWFNDLRLSFKLGIWLIIQGFLFRIQQTLWAWITFVWDSISSIGGFMVGGVAKMEFQTQLILVLIAVITIQTTYLSLRLLRLEDRISNQLEEMIVTVEDLEWAMDDLGWELDDVKDRLSDGGTPLESSDPDENETKSTGTGAVGGAIAGGALGASFGGPAGALGGFILGAILGDEIEKESMKNRRRTDMKVQIVEDMLREGYIPPNTVDMTTLQLWYPDLEVSFVQDVIEDMINDPEIPLDESPQQGLSEIGSRRVYLIDVKEAREFVRSHRENP